MDNKIIETSTKLFLDRGIKAVSMDDVAQQLGISKRTLYEHFSSKDELLMKCLEKLTTDIRIAHEEITTEDKDIIQLLVDHVFLTVMMLKKVSIAFLQDMGRIGKPRLSTKMDEEKVSNRERLSKCIRRGQEDGFFRTDINTELTISIFTEQSQTIKEVYSTGKYSMEDIFVNVFINYIRGICTKKGVERIDELIASKYTRI